MSTQTSDKNVQISFSNQTIHAKHSLFTIPSSLISQFKTSPPSPFIPANVPVRVYDPTFKNTVVCKSKISNISDSSFTYRGYPVDSLLQYSSFLELLVNCRQKYLPLIQTEFSKWETLVLDHMNIHVELESQISAFRYDAHPMVSILIHKGTLISSIAALSTFHPEANPALQGSIYAEHGKARISAIVNCLGQVPTMAAYAYRNRNGRPITRPNSRDLGYTENFLYIVDADDASYIPDSKIVNILDSFFILVADGGQCCDAVTMRHLTSSGVDPYTALSGAFGALFGERKCTAVIKMLDFIGTKDNIPRFIELLKQGKYIIKSPDQILEPDNVQAPGKITRLQGFELQKKPDFRIPYFQSLLRKVQEIIPPTGYSILAQELEAAISRDEYFKEYKTTIDYWSALILDGLGFTSDMFAVLMAIPRTAGLLSNWIETLDDPEVKIYRPRQIYTGEYNRNYLKDSQGQVRGSTAHPEPNLYADYSKSLPKGAKIRMSMKPEGEVIKLYQQIESTLDILKQGRRSVSTSTPFTKEYKFGDISRWVIDKMSPRKQQVMKRLEEMKKEVEEMLQQK